MTKAKFLKAQLKHSDKIQKLFTHNTFTL